MPEKKYALAIINRSFWPHSQVIGESLLLLAESVARNKHVVVITQSDGKLKERLSDAKRGKGVDVRDVRSRANSSSNLLKRGIDAIFFTVWTLFCLLRSRPEMVYVSTNPPVLVPFIVFIYSRMFGARYCYHLQDIHPEAANIVVKLNPFVFRFLQGIDNISMRNAESLVTLSEDMKGYILKRSGTSAQIHLLDNPAFDISIENTESRTAGFVFCGNAGRLQRIPLLLEAISEYIEQGGKLKFSFIGAGVYSKKIQEISEKYEIFDYFGFLPAAQAAEIVNQHRWALLPIDDEVTIYAFPSKSSSYAVSNCRILAICSKETSVAQWVLKNKIGRTCEPQKNKIIEAFRSIETEASLAYSGAPESLKQKLKIEFFVDRITDILKI